MDLDYQLPEHLAEIQPVVIYRTDCEGEVLAELYYQTEPFVGSDGKFYIKRLNSQPIEVKIVNTDLMHDKFSTLEEQWVKDMLNQPGNTSTEQEIRDWIKKSRR